MRTVLTRALPAAAIVMAAGVGGYLAYGRLVRPRTILPVVTAPAAQALSPSAGATGAAAGADRAGSAHGATTAAADEAPARSAIPDTFPDIAFVDRRGLPRRLSDWKGHPLLVNFWAPWCSPCREEIPLLERLSRQPTPDGLRVIGVAVDSRAAVLDYARRASIQYPLLIGERPGLEAVRALGLEAVFPFSVFVDARGRIVTVKIGVLRADQARLILARLADLERGLIDMDTARRQIAAGMARLAVARARQARGARL